MSKLQNLYLVVRGEYVDFTISKSIKCKKGLLTFVLTSNSEIDSLYPYLYQTPPLKNTRINESTLYYDGSDNTYDYYHVSASGEAHDNLLTIFQIKF